LVQFFYFASIARIEVAAAILLEYLAPALVVAFAWVVQRRPAGHATVGALVAAIAGCALVVRAYDPAALRLSTVGVLFGLGAALTFAAYILIGEHLQAEVPVPARLFYGFGVGLLVLFVLQPPWRLGHAVFAPKALLGVVVVGTLGTLAPFSAFMASLRYIDAGRATITSTLEPVIAGVIALFWFGESFAPLQLVGAALVIGAVVALQRGSPPGEAITGPDAAI
jgi:drug/metabolite transporter (DMT)-like permease